MTQGLLVLLFSVGFAGPLPLRLLGQGWLRAGCGFSFCCDLYDDRRRASSLAKYEVRNEPKKQARDKGDRDLPGWLLIPIALATWALCQLLLS